MGMLRLVTDNLRNALTGTGTGRDPRRHSHYAACIPLTRDEIAAAYSGSGLMRKIVNIPALDMVREWRDWKLAADEIARIEREERRLGIVGKIRQAEVYRALGGGALILGLPGNAAQEAPTPSKGQLTFVHVVSRWHLSFNSLQNDARLEGYGEPEMWELTTGNGQQKIHPSRVIAFRGDTSASGILTTTGLNDQYWGESVVAAVLDAVKDSDTARASFAALIHKAQRLRIGIPGLMDMVASGQETAVMERLAILSAAEGIHNATLYDSGDAEGKGGEKLDDVSYSFGGIKDVMNCYAEFVSAISDIPATRLLGRAPEGMNSSGDSQQRDWNKRIRAKQTLELAPCLDKLDRALVPSAIGKVPDGMWYEFTPLEMPTEKERAERFKAQMEAVEKLVSSATIPERALARGVQSLMIDEGYLPELEQALAEIPEAERWGIVADPSAGLPDLSGGGDQSTGGGASPAPVTDAAPRTLYVRRDLINAQEFIAWAKSQGFDTTLAASDLHVTIAYSRQPVDWMKVGSAWDGDNGEMTVPAGGARLVEPLGDKGAVVLLFASSALSWRHEEIVRAGASHDFDNYQPHVTITYAKPASLDLSKVEPFRGKLVFGPEVFEELNPDWSANVAEA